MNKQHVFLAALVASSFSALAAAMATTWKLAPNCAVTFDTRAAKGTFARLTGSITFDPADLADSKFEMTLPVASIDTGNSLKNRHARGEQWLDAATYPDIRFASSRVVKTATGYEAQGPLTMHGITRPVRLPFEFAPTAAGGTFTGHLEVNRLDYHVGTPGMLTSMVGEVVRIELVVPVTR